LNEPCLWTNEENSELNLLNVALKINQINFFLHRILFVLLVCTQLPSSIHRLASSQDIRTAANSLFINALGVPLHFIESSTLCNDILRRFQHEFLL